MWRTVFVWVCACSYSPTSGSPAVDAPSDCEELGTLCSNDTLLTCTTIGEPPTMPTTCSWGCVAAPTAHCGTIVPAGGAVLGSDLEPDELDDVVLSGATVASDGTINGSASGEFEHEIVNGIAVFRANSLRIDGPLTLRGPAAIAFAIAGDIVIAAEIDARGSCNGQSAGPGGSIGGAYTVNGSGSGGGLGVPDTSEAGAGGGSYGTAGATGGVGNGGAGALPGAVHGDATIPLLIGGSGGGGGGGGGGNDGEGVGGGGGGAVQFVSNTKITIEAAGSINAGGCGGGGSNNAGNDGSGAGGSGGTILLEAPTVEIAGKLAVNGGGGGGGEKVDGAPGALGRVVALGGNAASGTGDGGNGAFANVAATVGIDGGSGGGGGGGGGLGRIRVNTRSGDVTVTGEMSPSFEDALTATKAIAVTE